MRLWLTHTHTLLSLTHILLATCVQNGNDTFYYTIIRQAVPNGSMITLFTNIPWNQRMITFNGISTVKPLQII